MIISILAMAIGTAAAQDVNEDGCVDTYEANGACVSVDAITTSGLTMNSNAQIWASADVGPDVTVGSDAIIASRATIAGRVGEPGPSIIGANSVIERRVSLGADAQIGQNVGIGRASQVGARLNAGDGAQVGFGAIINDDVELASGVTVGSLVTLGDHTVVQSGAIIARGVQIADSDGPSTPTEIAGIIGSNATIGKNVSILAGARVRKDATIADDVTIGTNVRIGRDAVIESGVTLEDNVQIGAGATIGSGNTISSGEIIARYDVIDAVAGVNTVDQHTSPNAPFQTVYLMESQVIPSGGDLRVWYQGICEDAGLRPVMCDYTHWGSFYDARAWNAVILERGYWSCNVSSGVRGKTGWTNLISYHRPNNTTEGVYSETLGALSPGQTSSPICTDAP